jgi:hypothetical protein
MPTMDATAATSVSISTLSCDSIDGDIVSVLVGVHMEFHRTYKDLL